MSNDELRKKPNLGKTVKCKHCGKWHGVQYGYKILEDGTRIKSKTLAFCKCGDKRYLCGINGKEI